MINKRSIGSQFEQVAANYITEQGYLLLDKNFRCKVGEIDIIAKDHNYLVFVEVKYRKNICQGQPREAVDYFKQKKICSTALYYLMKKKISVDTPIRFDVVDILGNEINLIKNAFDYMQ